MKNVLFVCLGNSCRSQLAEGFARHYGAGIINVASAGLSSTNTVARETIDVMLERGLDISDHFPKDFEPGLAAKYDIIVNISGFILPPVEGPLILEWDVRDPYGSELKFHRQIRDQIEARVKALIADIQENGKVTAHSVGQRIAPEEMRRPRIWQRFTKWL